jgi:hypothetical protein
MLHYTCPGGNPAHTVLQLVSCCSNSPEALQLAADAWSTVSRGMTEYKAWAASGAITGSEMLWPSGPFVGIVNWQHPQHPAACVYAICDMMLLQCC